MIFCVVITLLGVAFFSFIMSAFIEIISNYDKKMGDDAVNREAALTNWLTLITRFQGNTSKGADGAAQDDTTSGGGGAGRPLPRTLSRSIEKHISHHFESNRLKWLEKDFMAEGAREDENVNKFGEGKSAKDDPAATTVDLANDDDYLNVLPRQIKRNIIITYLFDDVFHRFRLFFNTHTHEKDSKFLYDIAFGL